MGKRSELIEPIALEVLERLKTETGINYLVESEYDSTYVASFSKFGIKTDVGFRVTDTGSLAVGWNTGFSKVMLSRGFPPFCENGGEEFGLADEEIFEKINAMLKPHIPTTPPKLPEPKPPEKPPEAPIV